MGRNQSTMMTILPRIQQSGPLAQQNNSQMLTKQSKTNQSIFSAKHSMPLINTARDIPRSPKSRFLKTIRDEQGERTQRYLVESSFREIQTKQSEERNELIKAFSEYTDFDDR